MKGLNEVDKWKHGRAIYDCRLVVLSSDSNHLKLQIVIISGNGTGS